MRLQKLKLTNYGVFKNKSFDFGDSKFVVVYGPNEAGKSTLLQSLRESLFGMSIASEITGPKTLAEVTACLANGDEFHFRRRRGRKDLVEGEFSSGGRRIDESKLMQLLGPMDVDAYCSLFGFSLGELSRGQQALAGLSLTEALLGAKQGASFDWKNSKQLLVERRDKLMTAKGRTQEILVVVGQIQDLQKAIDVATTLPQAYRSTRDELDSVEARHALLSRELKELQSNLDSCERQLKAFPIAESLISERAKLQEYVVPVLLTRAWYDQWRHYESQLSQVAQTEEKLRREIADLESEANRIEPIEIPRVEIDTIRRLAFQATANHDLKSQLEQLQEDWTDACAREQALVESLPTAIVTELSVDFEVTRHMKEELRDLVEQIRTTERDLANGESRIEETNSSIEILRITLQQSAEPGESREELNELVHGVRDLNSSFFQIHDNTSRAVRDSTEVTKINSQLRTLVGDSLELIQVDELPSDAIIDEISQAWSDSDRSLQLFEQKYERAKKNIEQLRDAQPEASELVPLASLDDLHALRIKRQELWERWMALDRQSSEDQLPLFAIEAEKAKQRYLDHLAHEDSVIDSILNNVQEFSRREQNARNLKAAIDEFEKLATHVTEAKKQRESVRMRWQLVWQMCGVPSREPENMRSVPSLLRRRNELQHSISQSLLIAESLLKKWCDLKKRIDGYEQSTSKVESTEPATRFEISCNDLSQMPAVIAQLESEVRSALHKLELKISESNKSEGTRAANQAQLTSLQSIFQSLVNQRQHATKKLESQKVQINNWLQGYRLPLSVTNEKAVELVEQLEELVSSRKIAQRLKSQITQIEKTIDSFHEEVRQALLVDPAIEVSENSNDNVELLLLINSQLNEATLNRDAFQKLSTRIEELHKQLAANAKDKVEKTTAQVSLAKIIGLNTVEQAQLLSKVAQEYWSLMAGVAEREKQLDAFAHGRSLDSFLNELAGTTEHGLKQKIAQLGADLQKKQEDYDQVLIGKGNLEQRLRQMVDDEKVTQMTMDLEGLKAKLEDLSREWMVISTSILLLDRSIEEFQKHQQGAIMDLVRKNFSKLTCGRYVDVQADQYKEHTFHVIEQDQEPKRPDQLSQGTREQLYLALRFAFVQQYCRQHEPLPIVMDDCFVNFDDDRLVQTLEAVHGICQESQCIVLSCHRRTVEAVRQIADDIRVISLEDSFDLSRM